MRRFTPSGSRVTSTPPTVAAPAVGFSNPHSMRIVVDLPAPLLPRKPKISPRSTSKLTSSTATNWPKRRDSPRTSIAFTLPSYCAVELRLSEPDAGDRARAIELGLEPRHLRLQDVGRGGDADSVPLADDAFGFDGGAHF